MLVCMLHSLERRMPIQPNMLVIIMKFFKMLNLNVRGTEELLKTKVIEKFVEMAQDHRTYKMF